jgi:hypothetical protein
VRQIRRRRRTRKSIISPTVAWGRVGHSARANLEGVEPLGVLAGLVPAIHAAPLQEAFEVGGFHTAWMPGTSPGTTREGYERPELYNWLAEPDSCGTSPGTTRQGCERLELYTRSCRPAQLFASASMIVAACFLAASNPGVVLTLSLKQARKAAWPWVASFSISFSSFSCNFGLLLGLL